MREAEHLSPAQRRDLLVQGHPEVLIRDMASRAASVGVGSPVLISHSGDPGDECRCGCAGGDGCPLD